MAPFSASSKQSLIPSFLYSSSSSKTLSLSNLLLSNLAQPALMKKSGSLVIPSPSEPGKIDMYSPAFYAACTSGGFLSVGLPQMALAPVVLVKSNMNIDPAKFNAMSSGFRIVLKEQGIGGFFRGSWEHIFAFSSRSALIFGFYEFFKKYYADLAGHEDAAKHKTLICLAGSSSAAGITAAALRPFPSLKINVRDTMIRFASVETVVEMIYKHVVPMPRNQCSKTAQVGVSFGAGCISGVFCTILANTGANFSFFIENAKGSTFDDVVKKLGSLSLYTHGLPIRMVLYGTYLGAVWGIYDAFKVLVGLPTTGVAKV